MIQQNLPRAALPPAKEADPQVRSATPAPVNVADYSVPSLINSMMSAPVKPQSAPSAKSVWKVNLIYRQKIDNVMKNTRFVRGKMNLPM